MARVTWKGLNWKDIRSVAKNQGINAKQNRAKLVSAMKAAGIEPDTVKIAEIDRLRSENTAKIRNQIRPETTKAIKNTAEGIVPETDEQKRARLTAELVALGGIADAAGKTFAFGPNYWLIANNELRLIARSKGILTGMKPQGSQATFVENDRDSIIAALHQMDLIEGLTPHPQPTDTATPAALPLSRVTSDPLNKDCVEIKDSGGNITCKCFRMGLRGEGGERAVLSMDELVTIIVDAVNEAVNQQQGLATV